MGPERPSVLLITGADLRRGAPGGTRSYVLGLARFLARKRVSVEILSNGRPDDVPLGVKIDQVSQENRASTVAFQQRLREWSGRADWGRFGLLHFQRPDDLNAIRDRGLPPSICTLHGDSARGVRRRRGRLAGMAYLHLEAAAVPRFRALVAVDETTAESYRRRYPAAARMVHVIPVAVDDQFLEQPTRSRPLSGPTFLFVGRLSAEKRVDLIIEALRDSSIPGARLRIVGTGPAATRLRAMANGLSVEFLGAVPHLSLPKLYREADALVLASEYEGLPTVALEALASGCPVVAPVGCGLDSLITGGRGILVADVRGLGRALADLIELPKSKGKTLLPLRYTWSTVGEETLQLYRSVAPGVVA